MTTTTTSADTRPDALLSVKITHRPRDTTRPPEGVDSSRGSLAHADSPSPGTGREYGTLTRTTSTTARRVARNGAR